MRKMGEVMRRRLQYNLHQKWRWKRFKQQEGKCFYCGVQMLLDPQRFQMHKACTLEHRTPLSRGGTDHWENTAATCQKCNDAKGNMTEEEFRGPVAQWTEHQTSNLGVACSSHAGITTPEQPS